MWVLGWPHRSHGPAGSPGAGSDIRCQGGSFLHLANDLLLCLCRIFRIRRFCRSSSLSVFLIGVRCVYIRGVFLEKLPKGRQARKGVGATAEGFLQADGESFSQASATPSKTLSPGTLLCQECHRSRFSLANGSVGRGHLHYGGYGDGGVGERAPRGRLGLCWSWAAVCLRSSATAGGG